MATKKPTATAPKKARTTRSRTKKAPVTNNITAGRTSMGVVMGIIVVAAAVFISFMSSTWINNTQISSERFDNLERMIGLIAKMDTVKPSDSAPVTKQGQTSQPSTPTVSKPLKMVCQMQLDNEGVKFEDRACTRYVLYPSQNFTVNVVSEPLFDMAGTTNFQVMREDRAFCRGNGEDLFCFKFIKASKGKLTFLNNNTGQVTTGAQSNSLNISFYDGVKPN